MTQVRQRSTFLGGQHAFYQPADWPAPCQYHLQLHDMIPGDLWNDPDGVILLQKHILQPTGGWNNWRKLGPPFFFRFQQRDYETRIVVTAYEPHHNIFFLEIPIGLHTFAYNSLKTPVSTFAYGGSVTLAREAL